MRKGIILIDDDNLVNLINRKMIERVMPGAEICSFLSAYEALEFFHNLADFKKHDFVLFIDINMPGMNGWDLLEEIRKEFAHEHLEIHLLSSSIDPWDIDKAEVHSLVKSYIVKPLNVDKVAQLNIGNGRME